MHCPNTLHHMHAAQEADLTCHDDRSVISSTCKKTRKLQHQLPWKPDCKQHSCFIKCTSISLLANRPTSYRPPPCGAACSHCLHYSTRHWIPLWFDQRWWPSLWGHPHIWEHHSLCRRDEGGFLHHVLQLCGSLLALTTTVALSWFTCITYVGPIGV